MNIRDLTFLRGTKRDEEYIRIGGPRHKNKGELCQRSEHDECEDVEGCDCLCHEYDERWKAKWK